MLDKLYDAILGWPGLLVVIVLICWGVTLTPNDNNLQKQCEARGGKWVQTMKTYHTCKESK